MIRFQCSQCDKRLKVSERKAGTTIVCPRCEGHCVVPGEIEEANPETPSPQPAGHSSMLSAHLSEDAPSVLSNMPLGWRCVIVLLAGLGLLCLLLALVASVVSALDSVAPAAKYAAMVVTPLSIVAVLTILYGHGTSCPECGKWWMKRSVATTFLDKEVYEKNGVPFARSISRTTYQCDSCRHRWSATTVDEFKEVSRNRTWPRVG